MDTSGFLLPSGSSYQVAASACERVCTLADPQQWPVVRKGLAALYNVFDTLWKEQMTVSGILMNPTAWNDEAITALINIFNECDLESRGAILRGLHRQSDNLQIRTRIVEPYRKSLEQLKAETDVDEDRELYTALIGEVDSLFAPA